MRVSHSETMEYREWEESAGGTDGHINDSSLPRLLLSPPSRQATPHPHEKPDNPFP